MLEQPKPVVVVTGASKGIGLAVAKILLEKFASNVVTLSRTKTPELQALIDQHPSSLLALAVDVTDEEAVRSALNLAFKKWPHIDGLILNAGVVEPFGRIDSPDTTVSSWKTHFDVNFFSLVHTIQSALPSLRESSVGGRIIFVSSGAAVGSTPGYGAYGASKAAMNSLCRTIAKEETNIVSVAVRPGMVDSSMQDLVRGAGSKHMPEADALKYISAHKEGRLVRPEQAGHVIAALSLSAPMNLSGLFVNWDSDECKEFRE